MTKKKTNAPRLLVEPIVRTNAERIAVWRGEGKPLRMIAQMLSEEYKVTITDRQITNGLHRQNWIKPKVQKRPIGPSFKKIVRTGHEEKNAEPGRRTVKWNPNPDLKDFI